MQKNIIIGRNLLETLSSALYEDPIILFREYVQNSLDAYNDATQNRGFPELSDFAVRIEIKKESKSIIIRDNGYGIPTSEEFEKEMLSFGDSPKVNRTQFIGFRGIGRMAALPFCKRLVFRNKPANAAEINICEWQGSHYRDLLHDDSTSGEDFEHTVRRIANLYSEKCTVDDTHYFEVQIFEYGMEVEDVLENPSFKQAIKKLLPIKYSPEFTAGKLIIERYKQFMNEDMSDHMCSVYLDGEELLKGYTDKNNKLESGIMFWEIREASTEKGKLGDKVGLLWFTFNKKIQASGIKDDPYYGILVRSKNVLMGNNDTFADLCFSSREYVATYSELTATLRGVYGELLVNSPNLKDNARREWFRTDEASIYLKYVIVDFMRRLYKYRYAASAFYRIKNEDKAEQKREVLKERLVELVDIANNRINVGEFCKGDVEEAKQLSEQIVSIDDGTDYALEDMPRQSQTKRKNYNALMNVIEDFFKKEKMYDIFLKLRAYIKKHHDQD